MTGSIVDIVMDFEREMEIYLGDIPCVSAVRLGLHAQAGNAIYVASEALVVRRKDVARFEHYTDLAWSDQPGRFDTGNYVLYTIESPRIKRIIEAYWDMVEQEARWGLPAYQGTDA